MRWHGTNTRFGTVTDEKIAPFYQCVMRQPNKVARDFIWVLMFSAMRRSEVTNLRWEDVDLEKRVLTVPALFNKSKRLHQLPITDILFAVLQSRKALNIQSPFVFPGRADGPMKTGHMCEPRAVLLRIRKEVDLPAFIWHDLRRTALSSGEKAGLPYLALQRIANHAVRRDITDRYLVLDIDYLRPHMEEMNDRILGLMNTTIAQWRADDASAGLEEPCNFGTRLKQSMETKSNSIEVNEDEEEEEIYW